MSSLYSKYHTHERLKAASPSEDGGAVSLVTSPDGEIEVRAVMTSGCVAEMDITVLGRHKAALAPSREQEERLTSDQIWEQMIRQAWLDIVNTINRDKALYGINLQPLELDPLMPEAIDISEDMAGYHVSEHHPYLYLFTFMILG